MKEILQEVLDKIVPSTEQEKKLKKIVNEIKSEIDKEKPTDTESMLVGSVAKGTYLRHSLDIDFFILFPPTYEKDEMANTTISIGKKILDENAGIFSAILLATSPIYIFLATRVLT